MRLSVSLAVLAAALMLAGCGTSPGERAISGGAIGAGGGAVVGAMTGNPAAGALIGGAGGAAAGALTSPNQVDLGKPVWK